jgi:putative hydrolase of HD superfamily
MNLLLDECLPRRLTGAASTFAFEGQHMQILLASYLELNGLKELYRQGWLRRGVTPERCESVADHCFSTAVLAMLLADAHFPGLDLARMLRLALLHEFGEIYAGDITPADGVSAEEKHRREEDSVVRVLSKLPNGEYYISLWREYEENQTPEARFVRQVDRLEMALQAGVYQRQGLLDPGEFFRSADAALSAPELREILDAVRDDLKG